MSKMENAYLRELYHTNQCELTFHLKLLDENQAVILDEELNSVRAVEDTVGSLLQHTKNKIIKSLKDEAKVEVNISLAKGSCDIDSNTTCSALIQQFSKPLLGDKSKNLILKLNSQSFMVVVNAPLIKTIELPKVLYVDYRVQVTKFKSLFTDKALSRNIWFTSPDKVDWEEVGCDYVYVPTSNDLNKYLKLVCYPENSRVVGPSFEVVSLSKIQEMWSIPRCPFEDRHQYTKTKLKGSELRVVSYNTLSNLYSDQDKFPHCTHEVLSLDYRKQLIVKELKGYNADIICLQELDFCTYKHTLNAKLNKQYKGSFFKKGNRVSEGVACFYNSSRFRLLEERHIVFSHELQNNPLFRSTWKLLQITSNLKDNIIKHPTSFQLLVLSMPSTNSVILVGNTHLYYHAEASDIRLIQVSICMDYISFVARKYQRDNKIRKVGVIFCGDFNSVPESPLYEFVTNSMIHHTFEKDCETPLQNICLNHQFKFGSAYGIPKFTNYTHDFKACLDYIFYEKDVFNVIDCVPLPEESVLSQNTALPSQVFPSDHIALVTNLRIL